MSAGARPAPRQNATVEAHAPGDIRLVAGEAPTPGPGQVLLRTRCTLISGGTELAIFRGAGGAGSAWSEFAHYPRAMGYSHCGEVVALGEGVEQGWMGRRVASRGAHAAWVCRPVSDLWPVPEGVKDEAACFTTLAAVVGNGLRRAQLAWGESVAVFGLGLVGQLAVRLAHGAGAGPVVAVERSPLRCRLLPDEALIHGLELAEEPAASDALAAAREAGLRSNGGYPFDLVVEATGEASLIPRQTEWLRDLGRLLVLSSPRQPIPFDFHALCNRRSLTLVGAHGFSQPAAATPHYPWSRSRLGELFLRWLAAGRVAAAELVTHRFAAQQAADAYSLLAERGSEALGVILDWNAHR
jgi:threonine dehydrogenase-like Zn-dependent dehydrogenase